LRYSLLHAYKEQGHSNEFFYISFRKPFLFQNNLGLKIGATEKTENVRAEIQEMLVLILSGRKMTENARPSSQVSENSS